MYELITEIEIDSTPEKVWHALTDFQAYPEWNPAIRSIDGIPEKGEKIRIFYNPQGSIIQMKFTVEVINCEKGREFRWLGCLLFASLFAGNHYMTIQEVAPNRSKLIHGEVFSGLLKPVVWFLLAKTNNQSFEAMNQALKVYVEKNT